MTFVQGPHGVSVLYFNVSSDIINWKNTDTPSQVMFVCFSS